MRQIKEMKIKIAKYHGAGNDIVMVDNRKLEQPLGVDEIAYLCHRYFGVGADGLITIDQRDDVDFLMNYYNADGLGGMMCSNGARCAVHFAKNNGYELSSGTFSCEGDVYQSHWYGDHEVGTSFPAQLPAKRMPYGYYAVTGAPHLVLFSTDLLSMDAQLEGRKWRFHDDFQPAGTNVNFIQEIGENQLAIATYERVVEDLTLACGTGALAAAMAYVQENNKFGKQEISFKSQGGTLLIKLNHSENQFLDCEVIGPVVRVFETEIEIQKLSNK